MQKYHANPKPTVPSYLKSQSWREVYHKTKEKDGLATNHHYFMHNKEKSKRLYMITWRYAGWPMVHKECFMADNNDWILSPGVELAAFARKWTAGLENPANVTVFGRGQAPPPGRALPHEVPPPATFQPQ
jgi:hypothetical protein